MNGNSGWWFLIAFGIFMVPVWLYPRMGPRWVSPTLTVFIAVQMLRAWKPALFGWWGWTVDLFTVAMCAGFLIEALRMRRRQRHP